MLKADLQGSRATVSNLSSLIYQRLFTAQQIVWAVKDSKNTTVEILWGDYMRTVNEWNFRLGEIKTQLDKFGYEKSSQLLTDTDDLNQEIPQSFHYKFYRLHQQLLELKGCLHNYCDKQSILIEIDRYIDALHAQKDTFINGLNEELSAKERSLLEEPLRYVNGVGEAQKH